MSNFVVDFNDLHYASFMPIGFPQGERKCKLSTATYILSLNSKIHKTDENTSLDLLYNVDAVVYLLSLQERVQVVQKRT